MTKPFNKTIKQAQAVRLMGSTIEVLLEGGSRSGKTFIAIYALFMRALKYPNSRHIVGRRHFNHVKGTIWNKTFPDVAKIAFPGTKYREKKSDWYIEFHNGSQIWITGTDDKERVEKVLGSEWDTIYLNEASQMSYHTYSMFKTRLNPQEGIKPLFLIDYNPPSKRHWGYVVFHQGKDPIEGTPLPDLSRYAYIKMNPTDNEQNLSEGYVDTLKTLSKRDQTRFLDGDYLDPVGAIYTRFNESMIVTEDLVCEEYFVGIDLITYSAVLIGRQGESVFVQDECGGDDLIASELNEMIVGKWGQYRYQAYIDHNLSKSGTREFENSQLADKGPGSVEDGIDQINKLMENGNFFIHERCYKTRGEIEDYRRDDKGRIIKGGDHFIDGMRYAIYSSINRVSVVGRHRRKR